MSSQSSIQGKENTAGSLYSAECMADYNKLCSTVYTSMVIVWDIFFKATICSVLKIRLCACREPALDRLIGLLIKETIYNMDKIIHVPRCGLFAVFFHLFYDLESEEQ